MAKQTGPGTPLTDNQRIRYQPCLNLSNYDAPPFACLQRINPVVSYASPGIPNGTLAYHGSNVDGAHVIGVSIPSETGEERQVASDFVFNGPEVLRAGSPGRCTEDWPARCLHLVEDTLAYKGAGVLQDYRVGPRANSWMLWDSGTAFMWLGRDVPSVGQLGDKFEVGIIRPALNFIPMCVAAGPNAYIGLPPLSNFNPGTPLLDESDDAGNFNVSTNWEQVLGTNASYFPLASGIYEWDFHCTLSSSDVDATQGQFLTLWAYLAHSSGEYQLPQYVTRLLQIEIDEYGAELQRSAENVAMSGFVRLDDPNPVSPNPNNSVYYLAIKNMSAVDVDISAAFMKLKKIS